LCLCVFLSEAEMSQDEQQSGSSKSRMSADDFIPISMESSSSDDDENSDTEP